MSDKMTIVQFSLGAANYGINVSQTVEVERFVQITRIPRMPRFVEGFINLRGRILVVLDLRKQLGLRSTKPNSNTRILIVEVSGEQLGFIVDYVEDIKEIPVSEIRPSGEFALKASKNFVTGVLVQDKELIIILNFDALMHESEIETLRRLRNESKEKAKKR